MDNVVCSICCDEDRPTTTLSQCPHRFCTPCLAAYISQSVDQLRYDIPCPSPTCECLMHPNDVERSLHATGATEEVKRWELVQLRRALVKSDNVRWCPMPDCQYVVLSGDPRKCPMFHCELCTTNFCSRCLGPIVPNVAHKCVRVRTSLREKNKLQLSRTQNVRSCPHCRTVVTKIGGCNFVSCPLCRCEFCWFCGQRDSGSAGCFTHWTSFCKLRSDRITKHLDKYLTAHNSTLTTRVTLCATTALLGFLLLPFLVTWTLCICFPFNFTRDCIFSIEDGAWWKRLSVALLCGLFFVLCGFLLPIAWVLLYLSCWGDVLDFCRYIAKRESDTSENVV